MVQGFLSHSSPAHIPEASTNIYTRHSSIFPLKVSSIFILYLIPQNLHNLLFSQVIPIEIQDIFFQRVLVNVSAQTVSHISTISHIKAGTIHKSRQMKQQKRKNIVAIPAISMTHFSSCQENISPFTVCKWPLMVYNSRPSIIIANMIR